MKRVLKWYYNIQECMLVTGVDCRTFRFYHAIHIVSINHIEKLNLYKKKIVRLLWHPYYNSNNNIYVYISAPESYGNKGQCIFTALCTNVHMTRKLWRMLGISGRRGNTSSTTHHTVSDFLYLYGLRNVSAILQIYNYGFRCLGYKKNWTVTVVASRNVNIWFDLVSHLVHTDQDSLHVNIICSSMSTRFCLF